MFRELNEARNNASNEVVAYLDELICRVEASASAVAHQEGILDVDIEEVWDFGEGGDNQETPITSNRTEFDDPPTREAQQPTNRRRVLDMAGAMNLKDGTEDEPLEPEIMTEGTADLMFELGYDSDDEPPYFGNMEEEKRLMEEYNEETVEEYDAETLGSDGQEVEAGLSLEEAHPVVHAASQPHFVLIAESEIKKMVVDVLKKELKKRRLSTKGKKAILQERLKDAMKENIFVFPQEDVVVPSAGDNFKSGSYWKTLNPSEVVDNPTRETIFHGPTEDPETHEQQPAKKNFSEVFDRPVFAGTSKVPVFTKYKRRKLNSVTRQPETEVKTVKKGRANQEFLDKNKLDHNCKPHQFFDAFLPYSLTAKWNSYSTTKAYQENAGGLGGANGLYPDWVPFSVREFRQHIGVRLLHGISPTPRLEMKFKSQAEDPVNGNDLIYRLFGPNATRRHKHFRRFLTVQNPIKKVPPRSEDPNWKVREFLDFVQSTSMSAWICGMEISVDEQTLKFQGRHVDKLRISYKREGDGFQCDALCNDGYTFAFFFAMSPLPQNTPNKAYLHCTQELWHSSTSCNANSIDAGWTICITVPASADMRSTTQTR